MGPRRTHLEAHSPLVGRHHTNWRLKAIERLDRVGPHRELVFTAPMSISRSDAEKLREKLAQTAEQVVATAAQSDPEELYCFNMDWVKFR